MCSVVPAISAIMAATGKSKTCVWRWQKRFMHEGVEEWKGAMNEEITVTFDQEGLYGYKCLPHYGMGMVGVIKVGDEMANADAVEEVKHLGRAGQKMAELFDQLKTSQTAQAQ